MPIHSYPTIHLRSMHANEPHNTLWVQIWDLKWEIHTAFPLKSNKYSCWRELWDLDRARKSASTIDICERPTQKPRLREIRRWRIAWRFLSRVIINDALAAVSSRSSNTPKYSLALRFGGLKIRSQTPCGPSETAEHREHSQWLQLVPHTQELFNEVKVVTYFYQRPCDYQR